MSNFEFLGGYDRRTTSGTIAAPDAHKMVKSSALKISTPRKPKARSFEEIKSRAKQMGVEVKIEGKTLFLFPPKFDANGKQIGQNYGQYHSATKNTSWQVLDNIAAEILASKSDEQAIADGIAAKELII